METQNIEYKESWRDEYIKWICGFANAQGGKIYIGLSNNGIASGLPDAKKLLEEIPNKTRDVLGIVIDVNLKTKNKKNYIEIVVDAYPNPVSYKGQYHYRSGSTKQELKGAALDRFILKKQGKRWDAVPIPNLSIKHLSAQAIRYFKQKAATTTRVDESVLKEKTAGLIEKLNLKADQTYLKRACALLFFDNPEKYITGAYIKIGFFESDADLLYQDEVHGNLFEQSEKALDLLVTKYLKAAISYDGLHRVETLPLPQSALREALLNAIVHKDYGSGNPIQISVYHNKLDIWNEGQLPEDWTIASLKAKHPSRPYNPDVANAFFRAGLIETWGRGTVKIVSDCKKAKVPVPDFEYELSGFSIKFTFPPSAVKKTATVINLKDSSAEKVLKLIAEDGSLTVSEMADQIKVSEITIKRLLKALKKEGKISRLGSDRKGTWGVKTKKVDAKAQRK
jgi:ATP-dependent DNA helicase RecG